ncbi:hypothetical protein [Acetobacter sp.]|uniref:hypothetical protein n=1 Tax=Acetobacter sp. TaxID=440 RepID=UPI0039E9E5AF
MKIYSVWTPGDAVPERRRRNGLPILVSQKTRWSILFFGALALLGSGARITGLLAIALILVTSALLANSWLLPVIMLPGRIALAVFGSEIIEWELRLRGFVRNGVVAGPNKDAALLRYMDRMTGALPQAGTGNHMIPDPFAAAIGRA